MIVGADEVGYGAWAGPLVVCAVRAPEDWTLDGLNDSKKLSAKRREELNVLLRQDESIQFSIWEKSNSEIDKSGLGVCLKQAYVGVFSALMTDQDTGIIDGTVKIAELPRVSCLIKADGKIPAVMAASIIAKVYRDGLMKNHFQLQYPEYGFKNHVGYGTAEHKEAIKKHGMSSAHRQSYNIKL